MFGSTLLRFSAAAAAAALKHAVRLDTALIIIAFKVQTEQMLKYSLP